MLDMFIRACNCVGVCGVELSSGLFGGPCAKVDHGDRERVAAKFIARGGRADRYVLACLLAHETISVR